MKLTQRHRQFCREYVACGIAVQAYQKAFRNKNYRSCAACASRLIYLPEIVEYIEKVKRDEEARLIQLRQSDLTRMKEQVLTEIELDFFHSEVVRGNIDVEEMTTVKEYIPLQRDISGEIVPSTGNWTTVIRSFKRKPTLRERQISAVQLYLRKGSYAKTQLPPIDSDDFPGNEALDRSRTKVENFVILSNGNKIPIPNSK